MVEVKVVIFCLREKIAAPYLWTLNKHRGSVTELTMRYRKVSHAYTTHTCSELHSIFMFLVSISLLCLLLWTRFVGWCCRTSRLRCDRNSSRLSATHFWPLKPDLDSALQCRLAAVIAAGWWKIQHTQADSCPSVPVQRSLVQASAVQRRSSWKSRSPICGHWPLDRTEVSKLDSWAEVSELGPWAGNQDLHSSCTF